MGDTSASSSRQWCVAILSAREDLATLESTLAAVLEAVGDAPATVDVLVNGNPSTAQALSARLGTRSMTMVAHAHVRVWNLALRDKAHAWNSYVHSIWPGGSTTFFVDGCITVLPAAFAMTQRRLDGSDALAVATVPTTGRSAAATRELILRHPQIHGSLYALSEAALTRVRAAGLRLPLGFYRSDSLLGTLVNFNFDPTLHDWDEQRIVVVSEPTWSMAAKSIWNPADVLGQVRRIARQAMGAVEEAATKERFYDRREPLQVLHAEPLAFVDEWIRRDGSSAGAPRQVHWLAQLRMRHVRQRTDWALAGEPPVCLFRG